jgi:cytoskeleton protein RodZ
MNAQPAQRPEDDTLVEMDHSPGRRLRLARQARGLDIDRVAAELHLSPERIAALERDDYPALSGSVFVTGYMRSYARLLGLDPEPLLEAYRGAKPEAAQGKGHAANAAGGQIGSGRLPVRLLGIGLFAVACGLAFAWWRQELAAPEAPQPVRIGTADAPEASLPQPATVDRPSFEGASDDPMETGDGEASGTAVSTTQGVMPPASTETPAAVGAAQAAPATEEPGPEPVAREPDNAGAEGDRQIAAREEGEMPADEASPAADDPPPAGQEIVLSFSGPCWVDIRDSEREFKLFGEMGKGDRHVLEGTPPYSVILGNTAAVSITVGGDPYDLADIARGNVARFTLDPGARP